MTGDGAPGVSDGGLIGYAVSVVGALAAAVVALWRRDTSRSDTLATAIEAQSKATAAALASVEQAIHGLHETVATMASRVDDLRTDTRSAFDRSAALADRLVTSQERAVTALEQRARASTAVTVASAPNPPSPVGG